MVRTVPERVIIIEFLTEFNKYGSDLMMNS